VQKGVRQVTIDGKILDGNVLPILTGEHTVEVLMG
jgi:cellobiose phosphorylase